ncbi:MAG: hypothetical protein V1787_00940 [Candidatus Micrarchaeota archaeon]
MVLDELFGKKPRKEEPAADIEKHDEASLDRQGVQAAYYRKIIERYAALINENEEKTIPELKALVDSNAEAVQELRKQVLEQLAEKKKALGTHAEGAPYDYESDFLLAAEAALGAVRGLKAVHPEVSVSFWLSPKEILELGAADVFDKAILLCSLLKSLGSQARILVLELENRHIHPVVAFAYSGRDYALDACQSGSQLSTYSGVLDEALKTLAYGGSKFLKKSYEFDNDKYTEFEEAKEGGSLAANSP